MITALRDLIQGKTPGGVKRSGAWSEVRKHWLAYNPRCAVCGGASALEVHHKMPFHLKPELELDLTNLITLCESKKGGVNCHLHFGHLGNFRQFNPSVEEDATVWSAKIAAAPTEAPESQDPAA